MRRRSGSGGGPTRHHRRWAGSVVALLLLATGTHHARAQQPTEQSDPKAEHERAEKLFDEGRHADAAAIWERLLRTVGPDKAWRANYNLGLCYTETGQATLAVERFEAFVARVEALAEVPEALRSLGDDASSRIEAIRASHGRLELPPSPGVKVRIDGGPLRDVGFTAYVTPGLHTVEVIAVGGSAQQQRVHVEAGRALAIRTSPALPKPLPLPVAPAPVAAPPPRVVVIEEPPSFPTVWVAVGAGLTAAAFVFPGVMYGRASSARDDADALGAGHTGYPAQRQQFEDRRSAYQLSYLLPAGLAAVTATIAIVGGVRVATYTPPAERASRPLFEAVHLSCGSLLTGAACWAVGTF